MSWAASPSSWATPSGSLVTDAVDPTGSPAWSASETRTTVLRRSADDDDADERVIVANAEQLAIVTALANPEPSPGLIDRCLVAAYDAGLAPLLVLTKSDLADPSTLLTLYDALDVPAVVCGMAEDGSTTRGPR